MDNQKSIKDIYLIISIDVEEDMPYWKIETETTIHNLEGIPKIQRLFDNYNIRPTYLLDYPYVTNENAVEYFKSIIDRCEIGAHMHPWNTPPLTEEESKKIEYPSNLNYQRQYEKIKTVTDELTKAFGRPPASYRAGKFGFNEDTGDILRRLGYLVDSSVTPMVSWENQNGPSFLDYRVEPFLIDHSACEILEVPVTISLNKNLPGILEKVYLSIPKFTKIRGLLSKDYLNIVDLVWLYPVLFTSREMIQLSDVLIKRDVNVLNMFFHSSELVSGESIYHKTEKDVERFFDRLKTYFDYIFSKYSIKAKTLSEYSICFERSEK